MPEKPKPRHLGVLLLACASAVVTACGGAGAGTASGAGAGTGSGVAAEPAADSVPPSTPTVATVTTTSPPASASPEPSAAPSPSEPPAFTSKVSTVTPGTLKQSWREGCPVSPQDLRKITMTYWGFDKKAHTGDLVVNEAVTDDVVSIFRQLYAWRFPITRMEPIDEYGGSDFDSIEADNTSAFNCRRVAGSSSWSKHSYGKAIDINPRENPWVEPDGSVAHDNARRFAERPLRKPGVINGDDRVVRLFEKYGWEWGGYFNGAKDYQHFSKGGG
ncbi:M15 family metallopeptidase [Sphaerisporangium sp. NPDC051011]|uniref:M15 family metallopeptidase n=1 Tax=Sphaerisporangium sp. NPDC051011 TaxID=3155792 RepID=UPI0034101609